MGSRALRVGAAAILCALTLRLFASGLPGKLLSWLTSPDTAAFLIYLETGRDVRFSPSQEAFSVDFVESPPPAAPEPTEPPLPSFSDPEMVKLYYACSVSPDIGALMEQPLNWDLTGDQPTVLILHTHSTESYTRRGEAYTETSAYRTLDDNFNMLSIGRRVQALLGESGIVAVQDTSLHDYPSYNGSYADARKSIKKLLEEYPTIQMVLDLHRDASGGASQMRTLAHVDGQRQRPADDRRGHKLRYMGGKSLPCAEAPRPAGNGLPRNHPPVTAARPAVQRGSVPRRSADRGRCRRELPRRGADRRRGTGEGHHRTGEGHSAVG